MSDQLRALLGRTARAEATRFDAEHAGEETMVYERAIRPRRVARRALEAGAALVAVAVVGIGGYALAGETREIEPAVETPSPSDSATPAPSPSAEALWSIDGVEVDPSVSALSLADAAGIAVASSAACASLDSFTQVAATDGTTPSSSTHVGAFVDEDGAVNDVTTGAFASDEASQAYLEEAVVTATECGLDLESTGATAQAVSAAFVGVPGTTTKIVVDAGGGGAWTLWLHAYGAEVIAVVVEPGATDLGPRIVSELVSRLGG